ERENRVLVPVLADEAHTESLLDVALLLRGDSSETPLYALSVARRSGDDEPPVDLADARLDHVQEYTSEGNVPLRPLTMIAFDRTDAIVRAVAENQIRTLVVPWESGRTVGEVVFGRSIRRLLARTKIRVVLTRVRDPLNAVDRLHVYLPGRVIQHRGCLDGLSLVKQLAARLDVPLRATVIDGDVERYTRVMDAVGPDHPFEVDSTASYLSVGRDPDETEALALRVVLRPRPDARGWTSEIETVTTRIGASDSGVAMAVYLPESGPIGSSKPFRIE
ncbi:MAG: hypothetical protein ABEJ55_03720, partial [Halanaeroarchaeum sp.]